MHYYSILIYVFYNIFLTSKLLEYNYERADTDTISSKCQIASNELFPFPIVYDAELGHAHYVCQKVKEKCAIFKLCRVQHTIQLSASSPSGNYIHLSLYIIIISLMRCVVLLMLGISGSMFVHLVGVCAS